MLSPNRGLPRFIRRNAPIVIRGPAPWRGVPSLTGSAEPFRAVSRKAAYLEAKLCFLKWQRPRIEHVVGILYRDGLFLGYGDRWRMQIRASLLAEMARRASQLNVADGPRHEGSSSFPPITGSDVKGLVALPDAILSTPASMELTVKLMLTSLEEQLAWVAVAVSRMVPRISAEGCLSEVDTEVKCVWLREG